MAKDENVEFEIIMVCTYAEHAEKGGLRHWMECKVKIPQDFDWSMGAAILKKLQQANDLVGKG